MIESRICQLVLLSTDFLCDVIIIFDTLFKLFNKCRLLKIIITIIYDCWVLGTEKCFQKLFYWSTWELQLFLFVPFGVLCEDRVKMLTFISYKFRHAIFIYLIVICTPFLFFRYFEIALLDFEQILKHMFVELINKFVLVWLF